MLTMRRGWRTSRVARGFSLVELMVSILIGMIVVAGAVSLIVAIDQSNSETIQSTRLTQELRTLASVIADDIKRSRRVDDPIAKVAQGTTNACPTTPTTPAQPCYPRATTGTGGCITYGYSGTTSNRAMYNYRYIWKSGSNIKLDQYLFDPTSVATGTALPTATTLTAACPLATTPANTTKTSTVLNATEIAITGLCISSTSDGGSCYFDPSDSTCKLNTTVPAANEVDICIAGQLTAGDTYMKTITRAFVQPIFIRSGSAG